MRLVYELLIPYCAECEGHTHYYKSEMHYCIKTTGHHIMHSHRYVTAQQCWCLTAPRRWWWRDCWREERPADEWTTTKRPLGRGSTRSNKQRCQSLNTINSSTKSNRYGLVANLVYFFAFSISIFQLRMYSTQNLIILLKFFYLMKGIK